jgi:putative transposase
MNPLLQFKVSLRPRGHKALRRGRWSAGGAEYFLTINTHDRATGLSEPALGCAILSAAHRLTREGVWYLRCATVMPDHLHLLIVLGERIGLHDAIRLFKGRLAPVLRVAKLRWQRTYFERRLRMGEDRLPIFLYIYLNAYRAGLVTRDEKWLGYFCCLEDWQWFEPLTNSNCPFPEWLL